MSENPFPSELPSLLTSVLLVIEGMRHDSDPTEADWTEAEEALDRFDARQKNLVHRVIAADVQTAVDDARAALRAREVERARRSLIRVGQLFDSWLRNEL